MMRKIMVISTGGTIAMRFDPERNGLVPAASGSDLIEAVPALKNICELEVLKFSNIPSSHMTPAHMLELAQCVEKQLARPDIHGVVITHGTDTVEETAYFLDLYLQHEKPVCLTAAMRSASETSADGPANMLCAARVACDPTVQNYGVMVVLNDEIHAAADVTKTHTSNVKTFASPFWGPLGYVDSNQVIMHQTARPRLQLHAKHAQARVPIIKVFTGIDQDWLDRLLCAPLDGVVFEGFGRGNFPALITAAVQKLSAQKIPAVITSRVLGGRVLGVYASPSSGADLQKQGAFFAGELSSHKARIKLMLALGTGRDYAQICTLFSKTD